MPDWILACITSVGSIILTLTVTRTYNKLADLPAKSKKRTLDKKAKNDLLEQENCIRDAKIAKLETAVNALPTYRAQSLQIQAQLQNTDAEILKACEEIKNSMLENRAVLNDRIDRLEKREKNAIRAKLLDEYRLFTDESKNPMLAWSEMEHHAFFELVKDYEELKGNDYVHNTVVPAMNELAVIPMSDKQALLQLMSSRKL